MKKIIAVILAFILCAVLVIQFIPSSVFADQFIHRIEINVEYIGNKKLGEDIRDGSIGFDDFVISAVLFLDKKGRINEIPLIIDESKSDIAMYGGGDNLSKFLYTKNGVNGTFTLSSEEFQGSSEYVDPHSVKVVCNGVDYGMVRSFETENRMNQETGRFSYVYKIETNVSAGVNISGRTAYEIKKDNDPKISEYSEINGMPKVAEAGVEITFQDCLNPSGLSAVVDHHTIDGKKILHGEKFTMPAHDVVVGIVIKGSGGGGGSSSGPVTMSDASINLDLKNKDIDIYNGIKAPTVNDIKNALSVSSSVKNSGIKITDVTVDEIYDEGFYDDVDYEKAQRWAGNLMISFKVKVNDNYTFTNNDITDPNELISWQKKNINIKLNGVKLELSLNKLQHADGYFVSEYYPVGHNAVEIHIFWYGEREADYSLSGKKAGDTVNIPQSAFDYEGYFVYKYVLEYTDTAGEFVRKSIEGKSFVMPAHRGDVKLSVKYLRGNGKTALQQITVDTGDKIKLDVTNADFPQNTVVNVNLIQKGEQEGDTSFNTAKNALKDHAVDHLLFDISAKSYNSSVQPSGRVVVTFPIPQSYDGQHLSLCYVSQDGKYEEIPMEVNGGRGVAVLEHFSLYAIVKTKDVTDNTQHIIHLPEETEKAPTCNEEGQKKHYKCSCGKLFADALAKQEISAESITIPATHIDRDGDKKCDICMQEDVEVAPPPVTSDITESENNESKEDVSSEPTSSQNASQQASSDSSDAALNDGNNSSIWIILVSVVAAVIISAVVLLIIRKRK